MDADGGSTLESDSHFQIKMPDRALPLRCQLTSKRRLADLTRTKKGHDRKISQLVS